MVASSDTYVKKIFSTLTRAFRTLPVDFEIALAEKTKRTRIQTCALGALDEGEIPDLERVKKRSISFPPDWTPAVARHCIMKRCR